MKLFKPAALALVLVAAILPATAQMMAMPKPAQPHSTAPEPQVTQAQLDAAYKWVGKRGTLCRRVCTGGNISKDMCEAQLIDKGCPTYTPQDPK